MKKLITIGERIFEVKKVNHPIPTHTVNRCTLLDCYSKPSQAKIEIYCDWAKWALRNSVSNFGIDTFNTQVFTLGGEVKIDGVLYTFHITPSHNVVFM